MKTFSFIVPLILCILCLIYLLFYPCESKTTEHDFSAKALAKEKDHNTISNALFLTTGSVHKEKLEAYEKYYYYISNQNYITFSISSNRIQCIKTYLQSDTGNHISYHTQQKNNTLLLTPTSKETNTDRIFLYLTNQSVSDCTVQIQITTKITAASKPKKPIASKPKLTTPKPNKSTASNPKSATPKPSKATASNSKTVTPKSNKSTASNPKLVTPKPDKSSVSNSKTTTFEPDRASVSKPEVTAQKKDNSLKITYKEAILQPQFFLLLPNLSQKITITNYSQKNAAKNFTWLSTNPNIVTIKNGIITTHQEGTAIIYLKDKKHANNTSSCLIRVLGKEENN